MSTIDGLGESEDNVVDAQVVGGNAPGNSSSLDGSSPARPVLQVLQRLSRRETLVDISTILLWVVLSDVLLYHSGGYTAWGLFLTSAAAIMLVARRQLGHAAYTMATCGLIFACSLKLAWCGSLGTVVSGVAMLMALSMSINGTPPYLPDMLRFALHVVAGSGFRISRFSLRGVTSVAAGSRSRYAVALPLLVVTVFSMIFVRANPDLYRWLDGHVRTFMTRVGEWFSGFEAWEIVFWCFSAWLGMGLIYPAANYLFSLPVKPEVKASASSDSYLAVRNMLMSVVVLFAVYLAFEFVTLWFREFPEGFYYAGYAHEGAFWLTVALALATLVLSMAFRGTLVQDPRIGFLKAWAWIWSAENFLLGLAVVHRLFIYIDFNGMTRMRVIGLLGTLAVVIGFGLVV
ncbi:MAG: DUF4173 domain-containing protein [Pirellulaceae bacterium]|nr:DUF4173 domain-containing protein [Pirellulaceae bacterium]